MANLSVKFQNDSIKDEEAVAILKWTLFIVFSANFHYNDDIIYDVINFMQFFPYLS